MSWHCHTRSSILYRSWKHWDRWMQSRIPVWERWSACACRIAENSVFRCGQESVSDGMEGLCMLLKRSAYPCRYTDMVPRFSCPVPVISMVTNQVLKHRILQWNHDILSRRSLQVYTDAVSVKGQHLLTIALILLMEPFTPFHGQGRSKE